MHGNNQSGTVGTALADSLIVRITDPSDRPVVNARVRFVLSQNSTGGDVSPDTVTTDNNGEAPVRWVLGTIAGTQTIQARVVGFTNVTANLSATANAAAADTIFAVSGDGQAGTAAAALPESLVVRVNDQYGNPVTGTQVSWTVSGGGSVSPVSVATGSNGLAAVQRTLGPASGAQAAAASASGLKGSPVIFTHTVGSGAPAALQIVLGNNGTAPAGFALAESLVVRLVDANGNGVAGRAVAWAVTGGGGVPSPASTITDANGLSATQWTLGTTAGPNTLIASAAGFVANFAATGTSDVPTRISIFAGNNQTGPAGQPLPIDPTVLVQDANNNPVPNVAVTFVVTGGGGSIAPTTAVATGANGRAAITAWTLGSALGANTLQATASGPNGPLTGSPLTFTATAVAGAATQITITTQPPVTAPSGIALNPAPVVQIRDGSGNPVNTAGVNVTVSLATGTGPLGGTLTQPTNANGQATFTGLSINGLIGNYSLAFNSPGLAQATSSTIALAAGSPTKLALSVQPPGGASSGVVLSPQPVVQVQDAAGNPSPAAGVSVTAALTGASGSLGGTTTIVSNASGTAAFTDLAITGPSGTYNLRFTSTNPVLTQVTSVNITIGAGAPTTIAIQNGDNQTATAGATLPTDPSVVVRDAGGNPVSGVTVTFAVATGGGSITGATAVTNVSGIAAVGSWTIGCVAGSNTLTATSPGLVGSPLTFTATGNVGAASRIQIAAGNNQAATVGTPLAVNPSVLVTDACGNPVPGITTTWQVTAGGGSTIGGNTTTDASGLATVGWILGSTAGTNTLTVTRAGLTGSPVTFTATGVTGSANTIAVNAGNNQSATIGTAVAIDPSVIVTDGSGNPVSGVQVSFAVASGGGSASGLTQTTNANGIATVSNWTLGTVAGTNTLTATSTGLIGSPVIFTATGTTGAPSTITINGGNNQTAGVGATLPVNPSVLVRDIGGNPVPGVSVTFAVTSGGGSITGAAATTDGAGIATVGSWTLGPTAGNNTITATSAGLSGSPITFSATALAGAPANIAVNGGNNQTAAAGATLPIDPSVLVTDAGGNPVAGVSVTFAVASGGGSITGSSQTTNASGVAAVGSWTLGTTAGPNTLTATSGALAGSPVTFTATGTIGAATTITINGGNNQTAPVSTALPVNPSVKITDAGGNPVPGVNVTFAVASGGGSITGGSAISDAAGIATVGSWTLGGTPGPNTLTATSAGLTGSPRTFTATGTTGSAATMAINAGNNQSQVVNSVLATDPSVLVTDAGGNPVSGVAVTFAVAGGGGTANGTDRVTNVNGVATIGSWQLGTVAGVNTLTATSAGLAGSPITFTATGFPGAINAAQSTATVPNGAAGAPTAISIQARDVFGNNRTVGGGSWSVTVSGANAATPTVTDNGDGTYSATYTPVASGTDQVAIRFNGSHIGGSPYSSTVVPAGASTIAINGGNNQSATVNTVVATDPSVKVTDTNGNPVPGIAVSFAVASGGGSITGANQVTNASGVATVGSWQLGTTAGTNTLTATAPGLAASPLTFTATGTPGLASAAHSIATVPGGTAGSPTTMVVQSRDQFDNNRTSGGFSVTASITGANTATASVTDNGDGTYTAVYTPQVSGTDVVTIRIGANQISGSPYSSVVAKAASSTAITSHTPEPSVVGQGITVDVTVSGSAGTPGGSVTVSAGTNSCNLTLSGGSGSCVLTPTTSGNKNLTASYSGNATYSASTSPAVQHQVDASGGVSPSQSTLGVNTSSITASSGGSAVTVTVTAKDQFGNPVSGVTVSLSATGSGNTINQPGVTNGSGVTTGTISSTVAGTKTISAVVDGVPINPTQVVTVGPAAVNAAASTAAVPSGGSAGNPTTITVQGKDQFGNDVTTGGATVELTVSGSNTAGPITAIDNGDGTYTVSYTPTSSGPDQLDITLNGLPISGSPFGTTVAIGSPTQILHFAGNNQSAPIGTQLPIQPTVVVRDVGGNPVPGINVTFVVTGGGGSVSSGSGLTGSNGQVGVAWTLGSAAGANTLSASVTGLSGSPVLFSATATPGSPAVVIPSHTPNPSLAGDPVTVSYTVTASAGTPTGTVTVSDGVDSCVGSVGAGNCLLTLSTPGSRILTAEYGGDANFTAATSAGVGHTVNQASSAATITGHAPDPSVVGQGITVDVTVSGTAGTPGGSVTVSDGTDSCTITLSGGSGSCLLTPTTSGNKTLTASYGGSATYSASTSPGVPHQVTAAGSVSPSQSTLSVNASSIMASNGGSAVNVTVTARDQFGNPVSGVAVSLSATGTGNSISQPGLTDGSGVATGTVSSTVAEAKTISAVVDGIAINPTQGITVTPAAVLAALSTATVPSGGSAGNPTTITIQGKDQFGNDVLIGGATVELTVSGANTLGPLTATDNGDGTYTVSYTPVNAGPDQLDITLEGAPISGSPFNISIATASPSQIQVLAGNNQSAPIGTTLAVEPTVLVTDPFGNPVPGVDVQFVVTVGGGAVAGGGQSGTNGQVGVAWTLGTSSGQNELTATAAGLSGSPVVFSATATPGTPVVTLDGHGPDPSVVGEPVSVTFSVTSAVNTPTGNVTVTDGVDSCTATVAAGTCTLTLTSSGTRLLTASYGGDANFDPAGSAGVNHSVNPYGPVDPLTSTATVPDGIAGAVTTIVIVTRDQYGNLVGAGGASVTVDITGANPGSAAVTDNGDGTYTAVYTPGVAGSDSISIQVNSVSLPGSPFTSTVT
jgi:adhesin/invasin